MEFQNRLKLKHIIDKLKDRLSDLFSNDLEMFYEIDQPEVKLDKILFKSKILPVYSEIDGFDKRYIYVNGNDKLFALCSALICKDIYYPCLIGEQSFVLETYSNYPKLKYELYKLICKEYELKLNHICWVYDLETTGLIEDDKFPRITEIYMQDLTTGMVPFDENVKIGNYEYDEEFIKGLTGITREKCNQGTEYKILIERLNELLSICNGENCLFIAHNGINFDHRLLFKDIDGENAKIKTIDSMLFIPFFMKENPKSRKLSSLYEQIMGKKYTGAIHTSRCDVEMLLKIMKKLKINYKKFDFD